MNKGSLRLLFILSIVSLSNSMDRIMFSVLMEPIRLDLGLSDTAMGLLSGLAFTVFFAIFGIPLAPSRGAGFDQGWSRSIRTWLEQFVRRPGRIGYY